jgi:NAD(P)-dependent dehydrogenase (short-subunit alcohol dehydrogenase family)
MELATQGAKVLMVCRNQNKGDKAKTEIINKTGNEHVYLFITDLASFSSIRELVGKLLSQFTQLDVLINNAAAFYTTHQLTEDGIERQFQVNHLSGFLLTHLLMPLLKAAPAARIINVSSTGNYKGEIHFSDVNLQNNYNGLKAYRQSKLANVLFTYELARRLASTNITVNTLHPGVVGTQIGFANNRSLAALVWWLGSPFMLNNEQGAATSIYLATSEQVAGVTGKYFEKCKEKKSADKSYNLTLAKQLWALSIDLCKIKKGI